MESYVDNPMIEAFVYETSEMLDKLTEILIESEKTGAISEENMNEMFRIMHTIKGSSSMLSFDEMSESAHIVEDLFCTIRGNIHKNIDFAPVFDASFYAADYFKEQMAKIGEGQVPTALPPEFFEKIKVLINKIGNGEKDSKEEFDYSILVFFDEGCKMENIRAYSIVGRLSDLCSQLSYTPEELLEDNNSAKYIEKNGFLLKITTDLTEDEIKDIVKKELFIKRLKINKENNVSTGAALQPTRSASKKIKSNFFNIHGSKLDKLIDLVGEIVILRNSFDEKRGFDENAVAQFKKLTDELHDTVMSLRMVPIAATFHKMNRVVRDMCKNLGKECDLVLVGEDTQVDKVIADSLGDPIMHIVRNSMDHGIEKPEVRVKNGKREKGTIVLEAKNTGEEVFIRISDDGKGLDRNSILKKAKDLNLPMPEGELTDNDVYCLILSPGFSTKETPSEYSGRGVGMDVVKKNIESLSGSLFIESELGRGMAITIKIPLTLAIINGMEIAVGETHFIVSTTSIKKIMSIGTDTAVITEQGREMIMMGNACCPIIRLSRLFNIEGAEENLKEGILLCLESEQKMVCVFADRLIGEGQVVVKPLPDYLGQFSAKKRGVSGCTIMGEGHICLILDAAGLINNEI